jgi:hypothetical protein
MFIFFAGSPERSLELVKNLKTSSTRRVKENGHYDFSWQSGYGVFLLADPLRNPSFLASPIRKYTNIQTPG